ncbi:MAG: MFS transporter, partial [Anaerolineae bacterium]|nr:MFS transporter [Anaerolineae bacterium]
PVLGLIEGVAESAAALTKVVAGYHSDRIRRRKAMAIAGYSLSALARPLFLLGGQGWGFVYLARFVDRVGKGVRTAPRDALIAESTSPETRGRAYGLHRAMDFAGATLGALTAWALCRRLLDPFTGNLRDLTAFYRVFAVSVVPAVGGLLFLFALREPHAASAVAAPARALARPSFDLRRYDRRLRVFFLAQLLFTLGNSSNQFLLLRTMALGQTLTGAILMYIAFNLTTSALATSFGSWSDRIGRRRLLVAGYSLYAALYIGFGFLRPGQPLLLWAFWVLYGVYYAVTEGIEKALVAELAPPDSRATALGIHQTIVGVALLPASVMAGLLLPHHPGAPFWLGGALAASAAALVGFGLRAP